MQLREALAKKYNISKECFLFGDASNEIIQMITKAYLEQGELIINFTNYSDVSEIFATAVAKL